MRRTLAVTALLTGLALAAPAAAEDKVVTVPICDLEGHCDRHCAVHTHKPFVQCGYGPGR